MSGWRDFASRSLSTILPWRQADGATGSREIFLSSVRVGPRQHVLLLLDSAGNEIGRMPLAGRGHDIAIDRIHRRAAVFARRPGYFAVVVDVDSCTPLATMTPPEGHHYFGHGVFSADGALLYATENDFGTGSPRGVIGVYDATAGFARIGEFETHGLDAHEILLAEDGRTLVIANGGIETHPEYGRQKLNLADMRPSIVRIDSRTGDRLDETVLPAELNHLSMRHMTFDGQGDIWFGCQWEGEKSRKPPLVGRLGRDGDVRLIPFPDEIAPLARNYIGSVVASRDGRTVATSSPIGGTIFLFDVGTAALRTTVPLRDGCGLASPAGDRFLATSGDGRILPIEHDRPGRALRHEAVEFDNHMRRL